MPRKRPGQPQKVDADGSRTNETATEQTRIVRANVNREIVASPTFVTLYTNDTQLQVSPWDFRLIFGEISSVPTSEQPTVVVKQTGEVRMSPQHAKKVAMILMEQVQRYEQKIGQIPMPAD